VERIEIEALVQAGMDRHIARATVRKAIDALKASGVKGPTRIPWGEKEMNIEVQEFARTLITHVRDQAIQSADIALHRPAVDPMGKRWQSAADSVPCDELIRMVIADVVDETLFFLLNAIDDGSLALKYTASNGMTVDLTIEGLRELAGCYLGSDGWRATYSHERFVEDFPDSPETGHEH